MKFRFAVIALMSVSVLSGCSSIAVKSDYDHEVNFNQYRTLKWMPVPENRKRTVPKNSLVDTRIRRAVQRELEAKGFEFIESGRADALLAYHINVRNRVDVTHYGYRYWRPVRVHRYKEGSLILDVVDPRMKQLVWRGWATGVKGDIDSSQEKVNEVVAKMLKKFPPES